MLLSKSSTNSKKNLTCAGGSEQQQPSGQSAQPLEQVWSTHRPEGWKTQVQGETHIVTISKI